MYLLKLPVSRFSRECEADPQPKADVRLAIMAAPSTGWIDHTRLTSQTGGNVDDRFRAKYDNRTGAVRPYEQVRVRVGVDVEARRVAECVAKVGEADGT